MASTRLANDIFITGENANIRRAGKDSVTQIARARARNVLGTIATTNVTSQTTHLKPGTTAKSRSVHQPLLSSQRPRVEINEEPSGTTEQPNEFEGRILQAPERPADVRDIDSADVHNPQLVSDYINEIYVYLRLLEESQAVRKNYMDGYGITPRMRTILIDWLVQVHNRFRLLQETLYLTVAILDRFLQDGEISKTKLQLVGVTAMWIASKYEEMYAPEIADFVYITDNAYTKANIRQMERMMLKRLKFELGRPLPLHFLRRYSKAAEVDSLKHTLAKYLLELSITDYHLVHIHPSKMSAACLLLSTRLLDDNSEGGWDATMQFYSTYIAADLQYAMNRLALLVQKSFSCKQQAIRQKYHGTKFMRVSDIEELQSALIDDYAQKALEDVTS